MVIRKNIKSITVFLTMLLLVVSNSKLLVNLGIESIFEYGAYFVMLCGIAVCFLTTARAPHHIKRKLIVFAVVSVLFSIGIAVQGLPIATRLRLIATMLVISVAAILAEDYFDSVETMRFAAYGLFAGTLVTTVISLVANISMLEPIYDGFLPYGFTGGVQFKNFYAAFLLGSFMGLYFYNRFVKRCVWDIALMALQTLLIVAASAKGTYIFFAFFLFAVNAKWMYDRFGCGRAVKVVRARWQAGKRWQRVTAIACVAVVLAAGFWVLYEILLSRPTFAIRFKGVTNYLKYVRGDWYHIIFGNAEMAWSMPEYDYIETLRRIVGWDGSYEMGFINTLIKNGALGLIGFAVLFTHSICTILHTKTLQYKTIGLSVVGVLLLSAFVESFVCNIHSIFGIYCYLVIAGVCGMIGHEQETEQVETPLQMGARMLRERKKKSFLEQKQRREANDMEVMVTISCLVYNHEKYLRKTFDGFVNQKTNFPYEIIVHDDASTDGSAAIIREYCEKYPHLFRPIFQEENQHSKKIRISKTFIYPLVKSKYIATCEGDDYWCDENKLQMQVDYMETHPDCSMCVHDTALIDPDGHFTGAYLNGSRKDRDYTANDIIKADGGGLCQTSSYLAKRHVIAERPETFDITGIGDFPIAIYAGVSGYVHYIGRVMSCYRVGHSNSWSTRLDQQLDRLVRQRTAEYEDLTRMDKETGYRHTKAFAIPRGLRLSILYRKKYGVLKLLTKPSHLLMVVRTHCYTFPRKIYKKILFKMRSNKEAPRFVNER